MMAGLFLILALAILLIYWRQRKLALLVILIGIILGLVMLWQHATDVLKINL